MHEQISGRIGEVMHGVYSYNPSSEILKIDGKIFSFIRIDGDDMVLTIGPMGPKFPDEYGDFYSDVIKIYLKRDLGEQ